MRTQRDELSRTAQAAACAQLLISFLLCHGAFTHVCNAFYVKLGSNYTVNTCLFFTHTELTRDL